MRKYLLCSLLLFSFNQAQCYPAKPENQVSRQSNLRSKENRMDIKTYPFQLNESEFNQVEISYLSHTQKLNAGFQEIIITGKGILRLKKTESIDAKPEIVEGKIGDQELIALLSLMEEENFLGLEDEYKDDDGPHGFRIITLKMKGKSKSSRVVNPNIPQFERITGAIKVTTGAKLPQALNHIFFPNL
jgi:hypothetical protein